MHFVHKDFPKILAVRPAAPAPWPLWTCACPRLGRRRDEGAAAWQPVLFKTRKQGEFKSLVRRAIDVDPLAI